MSRSLIKSVSLALVVFGGLVASGCGGVEPAPSSNGAVEVPAVEQLGQSGGSLHAAQPPSTDRTGADLSVTPATGSGNGQGSGDTGATPTEGPAPDNGSPTSKGQQRCDPEPAPWTQKRDTSHDS